MSNEKSLVMFTIYKNPADYPDKFVIRCWVIKTTGAVPSPTPLAVGDTIEEVRTALPPGVVNIGRERYDDPVIAEVWI